MSYVWAEFELDVAGRRLRGPDGELHVEPGVFDVLAYLVANHERVVAKQELLEQIWGDQFVSESAITTRIKEVRRALGDDGRTQRFVRNVHGRGYQFVGELQTRRDVGGLQLGLSIAVDTEYRFVGRDAEIAAIEESLGGGPGSKQIFIGGSPGLGKSRLAIEVMNRLAASGARVCAGRCDEQVAAPLQPIRDAVSSLAQVEPERFARWADGVEGPLTGFMPSLGSILGREPLEVDGYARIDVLATVIERAAADERLVLLVDDLHWSDEPTRTLLGQLHRRFNHRQIVSLCTFRTTDTDLGSTTKKWISSQSRQAGALRIDLAEFDDVSSAELINTVLGSDDSSGAAELISLTGGHALFLTELLRDRQRGASASGSVDEVVSARLDQLDGPAQALVRTGAALGPEFSFDVAATAADLEAGVALDAIDQAVSAELFHETASASRFRFSHQLVPEAVLSITPRSALARIHHRCAAALEEYGAEPVEVAFHTLGAVPLVQMEEALDRATTVAAEAIDDNRFDQAIRLLERCLDVGPPTRQKAEVLAALGSAWVWTGQSPMGVRFFDETAELARRNGWADLLVMAALGRYGRSPFRRLADTETRALIEEALDEIGDEPSIDRARLLGKLAAFSVFTEPLSRRDELSAEALAMVPDASPVDRMELLESRAIALTCPAGLAALKALDEELSELREETNTYWADAAAPEVVRLMTGDGDGLRSVADFDERRARVQPIAEWRDLVLRSLLAAFAGDFTAARDHCNDAVEIGERFWGESAFALHGFGLLFIDSLSGEWSASREAMEFLYGSAESFLFLPGLGWSMAMAGETERAAEIAREVAARPEPFEQMGEHIMGGNFLVNAAELGLAVDFDELCQIAERYLVPFADIVLGVPWAGSFAAADPLARLARRRGDDEAADRYNDVTRRLYSGLDAPALLQRLG